MFDFKVVIEHLDVLAVGYKFTILVFIVVAGSAFFSETGIGLRHEGVGVQEGG